jgi:GDPmannose 4,6-dehydratase
MQKTAFITGISGQDGSYLSEYLLEKGYRVTGIVRRNSVAENQDYRIKPLVEGGHITTYYGDLLDPSSLEKVLKLTKPDEIYNLASQSHVRISFEIPQFTTQVNALGVANILEVYRKTCPEAKFYQASSSEMFGDSVDSDGYQREDTPMCTCSPYGCAKLFSYNLTRVYRKAYGLFACNGILFNHESPRRGSNFVTTKVIKGAIRIKRGEQEKLELGNLDAYRDWGHAKDYVRAMHAIVSHTEPDDFVICTGKTHSVRELCDYVFGKLGLNYEDHVVQNPKFIRPDEVPYLRGDCVKAKDILKWKPEYSFEDLIDEMVEFWLCVT